MDLDQVVTREDEQLQTVGHHWPLSGPLPKKMRDRVEQTGVCIVCHEKIPAMSWGKVHQKSFHYQEMKRILRRESPFMKNQKKVVRLKRNNKLEDGFNYFLRLLGEKVF